MPVHPAKKGGKPGHQFGESGKVYTGPGSKAKAQKQQAAAYANGYAPKGAKSKRRT